MYLQNRQFSNKHSEPTTICSCKKDNKCTAKAHGQNEYSEPTTICTCKTDNVLQVHIVVGSEFLLYALITSTATEICNWHLLFPP
jgi:hypothetical protein